MVHSFSALVQCGASNDKAAEEVDGWIRVVFFFFFKNEKNVMDREENKRGANDRKDVRRPSTSENGEWNVWATYQTW